MTEAAELAERIRSGGWGWTNAFDAWFIQHGAYPDIHIQPDGTRVVLRDATEFIKTNVENLPRLGLAAIVQDDGTLSLDSAGEYRYRPLGVVDHWGFTAYERMRP